MLGYDPRVAASLPASPPRAHPGQSQCPAVLGELQHQICGDFKRHQSKARKERQAPLRNWQVDRAGKPGGCSGQGAPKSQIPAFFRVGTGQPSGSRSRG